MSIIKKTPEQLAAEVLAAGKDLRKERTKRKVTPTERRTGWTAGITDEEVTLRGCTLLAWLIEAANERGLQLKEMAEAIGVTYGYIHQLRTGIKPIPGLSEKVIDGCAKFLGVPRLAILVAADIVRVDDFYLEPDSLSVYLEPALHLMQRDPEWGAFVHPSVFRAEPKVQHLLILLYEEATNRKLIPTKVNLQGLLDALGEEVPETTANDAPVPPKDRLN
ncbi:helix-turn-helix domain-containing protein [Thiomonas sp.]